MNYLVKMINMTYGRKNLRFIYSHRNDVVYPYYMDIDRGKSLIKEVIEFYENNIDKRYSDIDWDELKIIIGDDKLYNAIKKVMTFFYKPIPKNLTTIDPKMLRTKVFQLINKLYGGFVPSSIRNIAINEIKNALGISEDINLDEILWIDELDEAVLKKIREPSIKQIIELFNYETIDTICTNAYKIYIEISKKESSLGAIAKTIGKMSKLYGVTYDARYIGSMLRISLDGPRAIFKRSIASYGSRLSLVLFSIIPKLYSLDNWLIYTYVMRSKKNIKLLILSNIVKPPINYIDNENKVKEVFDSSIEESIYRVLKSLDIDVRREEEAIALGNILYIPDFKICRNSICFYVEVVGYWRKEYIERKMYKLSEVSKVIDKIIVIADEKLKHYLNKLKIPVIYYTVLHGKPVLNYRKVLELINSIKN